mgnify:CR=1 FL=1
MQHPTPVFADPVPHFRFPLLGQFHDFGQQQLPHQAHVDQKRADGDQSVQETNGVFARYRRMLKKKNKKRSEHLGSSFQFQPKEKTKKTYCNKRTHEEHILCDRTLQWCGSSGLIEKRYGK